MSEEYIDLDTQEKEQASDNTDVDVEREAFAFAEEEEKKSRQKEEMLIIEEARQESSQAADQDQAVESELIRTDDGAKVTLGNGTAISITGSSKLEISLDDDNTIRHSSKENSDNYYTTTSLDGKSVEYDFSNLDLNELGVERHRFTDSYTNKHNELEYKVDFSFDKEGNIEITSIEGDAAGRVNLKDGDKTYTIGEDGKLVEIDTEEAQLEKQENEEAKEKPEAVEIADTEAKSELDAALENIDLSEIQESGVGSAPVASDEQEKPQGRGA